MTILDEAGKRLRRGWTFHLRQSIFLKPTRKFFTVLGRHFMNFTSGTMSVESLETPLAFRKRPSDIAGLSKATAQTV